MAGPAGFPAGPVRSSSAAGLLHALELVIGVGVVRVIGVPATGQIGVTRLLDARLLGLGSRLLGGLLGGESGVVWSPSWRVSVSAPAGSTGSTAGAVCACAGDEVGLPANAMPAPLMSRIARALNAGWRKRAMFIGLSLIADRTGVRFRAKTARAPMNAW